MQPLRRCKACNKEFRAAPNTTGRVCSAPCAVVAAFDLKTGLTRKQRLAVNAAKNRQRSYLRDAKKYLYGDVPELVEIEMRNKARRCPLCGVRLIDLWHQPNSKELDHIVPICMGGTHTIGNVRIICRRCNQLRPKDGSDYAGPVTLWAAMDGVIAEKPPYHSWLASARDKGRKAYELRITGLSWADVATRLDYTNDKCAASAAHRHAARHNLALPEHSIAERTRRAYELRTAGMKWSEIGKELGLGSSPYQQTVRWARDNGMPNPKRVLRSNEVVPAKHHEKTARPRQAYEMLRQGMDISDVATVLGYTSRKTIRTVVSRWAQTNGEPIPTWNGKSLPTWDGK